MLVADPYLQQTFSFNLIEYFNLNVYPTPLTNIRKST